MTVANAEVHLRRAYGLIHGVEQQLEQFRSQMMRHSANVNADEPFVSGMITAFQGSRRIAAEKAALRQDIDLAWAEIDRASQIDSSAKIEADGTAFDIIALRAGANLVAGELELSSGQFEPAKQCLRQSIELLDNASAHYMLGLISEEQYNPTEAVAEFEKCLQLEPDGELSVRALRDANRMRNYRKQFRGTWGTFGCLLTVFFPLAFLYYFANRK